MAKRFLGLAILFFFVASSSARTAFDFPKFVLFDPRNPRSEPELESDPPILLPSQKSRSEPAVDLNSDTNAAAGGKLVDSDGSAGGREAEVQAESGSDSVASVPLTLLNFHPINRRFPHGHGQPFWIRRPRPCHHRFKPTGSQVAVFRSADDMILTGPGLGQDEFPMIPMRYGQRVHHPHHQHDHHRDDLFGEEERQFFHGDEPEGEEKEEGGFVNRIRKFLEPLLG